MANDWASLIAGKVEQMIQIHADSYAEILAMCDRDSWAFIEAEAVVAWAGYTPTTFIVAWGIGTFGE